MSAGREIHVGAAASGQGRRLRARDVVLAAMGTYRRRFWRVALAALAIMVPVDLIVSLLEEVVRSPEGASTAAWVARVGTSVVNVVAATLGTTFFAGLLDRVVAVDQHGREDAGLLQALREVPVVRLILVDLAAVGLVVLGIVAFVIPGLVLVILLSVVGPILVIEDLRVWPALRRSAQLVWPHVVLTFLLVVLPYGIEESIVSWAETHTHGVLPLKLFADIALTAIVGSFVGILEITLAHGLIADRRWRLSAIAADDAAEPEDDKEKPAAPGGGGAAG